MNPLFATFSRPHLIGIGGIGMEALARLLREMGCTVSGTDIRTSAVLQGLQRDGFRVQVGHDAGAVEGADLVVYSAAVPEDSPERRQARRLRLPTVSRAELLGAISRQFLTVGVAGSHGKTTTASILAEILIDAGWDPSVAIGGWRNGRSQARLGSGRHFVVEADEFRQAFLRLAPSWALITSVDLEHLDCYADLAAVENFFGAFLQQLPFYGFAVVAGEGCVGNRVLAAAPGETVTYGFGPANECSAVEVQRTEWGSRFELLYRDKDLGAVELPVPGAHNVLNATGAAAMALRLGVDPEQVRGGLSKFTGVSRRFEKRGEAGDTVIVDDYAHHPRELSAALATARNMGRRLVTVFQPHLFSRTRALYEEFAAALASADEIFLAPVYGAREKPLPGVDSGLIAGALRARGHQGVHLLQRRDEVTDCVLQSCRAGDLVLTVGAGDIDQVAGELAEQLAVRMDSR